MLILFENNGDTALSDLYINDVLPAQFEIKDWELKSADGKRDDVTMTSEDGEGGLHIVWHVPKVEKGERLEVSFDIKGSGEVDAEALNRFHGVHFGDEIESDDLPALESEVEPEAETEEAEATEGGEEAEATDGGDEAESSEAEDEAAPKMKFREDMLLRVMEAAGIDASHRDEFVAFAADYDHDDNGYLKKAELEDAAKAWQEAHAEGEATEEESEASTDEAESAGGDEKSCMICDMMVPADAATCAACGFTFVDL